MKTYNNLCVIGDNATTLNTGFKKPGCLESLLELPLLSNGQNPFATVTAFETVTEWKSRIADKSIVPLFDVYEVADGSTEDTFYETGKFKRRTEKGKTIITCEMYLSICAYAAVKSFEQSNYTELYQFNQESDYSGVYDSDGIRVRGRSCEITVDRRPATKDKVPYVTVEISFSDKDDILKTVLTKSDLQKDDLDGIYDVQINTLTVSSSSIKFTVTSSCAGNEKVTTLETADIVLKDASGDDYTFTFVAPDSNGVYELTGTGFGDGFTIDLNGVIVQTDIMYESVEPATLSI